MAKSKVKVSVTLSRNLVANIDRQAARQKGQTRSSILEAWLRLGAQARAQEEIEAATIAYYENLTEKQRAEHRALAEFSSRAARQLDIDEPARRRRRRHR